MKIVALFCALSASVCFGGDCKNGMCSLNRSTPNKNIKQEYTSSMPVVEVTPASIPVVGMENQSVVQNKSQVRRVKFFKWFRRR